VNYISRCVESILSQDYPNIELIVVDDCSNDGTWELLQNVTDNRIKLLRTSKNSGDPTEGRNLTVENMSGDYVTIVDADDYLGAKSHISDLVSVAQEYGVQTVKGKRIDKDDSGKLLSGVEGAVAWGDRKVDISTGHDMAYCYSFETDTDEQGETKPRGSIALHSYLWERSVFQQRPGRPFTYDDGYDYPNRCLDSPLIAITNLGELVYTAQSATSISATHGADLMRHGSWYAINIGGQVLQFNAYNSSWPQDAKIARLMSDLLIANAGYHKDATEYVMSHYIWAMDIGRQVYPLIRAPKLRLKAWIILHFPRLVGKVYKRIKNLKP
jgi:glycosyltransferase involved in cell wall biosynthesis